MAGALAAGHPAAIVNLFLGRCLIRGLMAGSVKG
jgi:ABC-type glycerol-3-phosphate transport system permease component